MKFLADENVARSVIQALQDSGHDVSQAAGGMKDSKLAKTALAENRTVITHDKDFAFAFLSAKKYSSVILLKFSDQRPVTVKKHLLKLLQSPQADNLEGRLVTLTELSVRIQEKTL